MKKLFPMSGWGVLGVLIILLGVVAIGSSFESSVIVRYDTFGDFVDAYEIVDGTRVTLTEDEVEEIVREGKRLVHEWQAELPRQEEVWSSLSQLDGTKP